MTQRRIPEDTTPPQKSRVARGLANDIGRAGGGEDHVSLLGYYGPFYAGSVQSLNEYGSVEASTSVGAGTLTQSWSTLMFGDVIGAVKAGVQAFSPTQTTTLTMSASFYPGMSAPGPSPVEMTFFYSTTAGGSTFQTPNYESLRPASVSSLTLTPSMGVSLAMSVKMQAEMQDIPQYLYTTGGTPLSRPGGVFYYPSVRLYAGTPGGGAPTASFGFSNMYAGMADGKTLSMTGKTTIPAPPQLGPGELDTVQFY